MDVFSLSENVFSRLSLALGELSRGEVRRCFVLDRYVDATGVSGTGRIARGWELQGGLVVLEWLTPEQTVGVYESLEALMGIHGHGGATVCRDAVTLEVLEFEGVLA